jgi:hypothetical protein
MPSTATRPRAWGFGGDGGGRSRRRVARIRWVCAAGAALLSVTAGLVSTPQLVVRASFALPSYWNQWPAYNNTASYGALTDYRNLAPGDYRHDGHTDLAFMSDTGTWVIDYWDNHSTTDRGASTGFGTPDVVLPYSYGGLGTLAAAGDYDGDGYTDLAILDTAGTLHVAKSSLLAAGSLPYNTTHPPGWTCGGTGQPACATGYATPSNISKVLVRDYDGDGKADFAYETTAGTLVIDYSVTGRHTYNLTASPLSLTSPVVAPADYNGDGITDIGVLDSVGTWRIAYSTANTAWGGTSWSLTLANGYGGSTVVQPVPADYAHDPANPGAALAVVDTAGYWYVALRSGGTYGGWAATQPGFKTATATTQHACGYQNLQPCAFAFDVDGDSKADISMLSPTSNRWLVGLTTNSAATPPLFTAKSTFADSTANGSFTGNAAVGDYDHDGRSDMAYMSSNGTWTIDYAANGFSGPDLTLAYGYGGTGTLAAAGDYDGDGYADLATLDTAGTLHIAKSSLLATGSLPYNNTHPPGWTCTTTCPTGYATPSNISKVLVRDYDGDGKADFAYETTSGTLVIDYSVAGRHTYNLTASPLSLTSPVVAPADYNGDGITDIGVLDSVGTWRIAYSTASTAWGGTGWSLTLANGYGGSTAVQPVPADYAHSATNPGAALAVVDNAGYWYVANRSSNTYGGWTSITPGFTLPGGATANAIAMDTDGDGKADKTIWGRYAYSSGAYTGDPAAQVEARWFVDNPAVTRASNAGYWQGESTYGGILDDTNPSLGNYNVVQIAYGTTANNATYVSGGSTIRYLYSRNDPTNFPLDTTFLRNRIQAAINKGATVVIDLSYFAGSVTDTNTSQPDGLTVNMSLTNLHTDLCPNNVCYPVWLEPMDEPYVHGQKPALVAQQVNELRSTFPTSTGVKIFMLEGSNDGYAPGGDHGPGGSFCNTTTPVAPVSLWCWYANDPATAIPANVDDFGIDGYVYSTFQSTMNSVRGMTTKPVFAFTPTYMSCPTACTPSFFPVSSPCQYAYSSVDEQDGCPPEDEFRFTDFASSDPQIMGYGMFMYGRLPDWYLNAHPGCPPSGDSCEPWGIEGMATADQESFLRVQRSMMKAVGR